MSRGHNAADLRPSSGGPIDCPGPNGIRNYQVVLLAALTSENCLLIQYRIRAAIESRVFECCVISCWLVESSLLREVHSFALFGLWFCNYCISSFECVIECFEFNLLTIALSECLFVHAICNFLIWIVDLDSDANHFFAKKIFAYESNIDIEICE